MSDHLIKVLFTDDVEVSEDVRERIESLLAARNADTSETSDTGSTTTEEVDYFSVTKGLNVTESLITDRVIEALGSNATEIGNGWSGGATLGVAPVSADYMLGTPLRKWKAVWAEYPLILTSDENKKHHIKDSDLGLDFIMTLRPVSYKLRTNPRGARHYGFIGQEVKPALKGRSFAGVVENEAGFGLMYTELIAPLVKAVQEQQKVISDQQSQIDGLKAKLQKLGG